MPLRRAGDPPAKPIDPAGARSFDDLIGRLRELRAWAGLSYREVHRRVVRARKQRGVAELPAYNTVYRALQPGRSRLDVDLLADIAGVLLGDDASAVVWRQACQAIASQAGEAAVVAASDTLPADLPEFTGRRGELGRLLGLLDPDADADAGADRAARRPAAVSVIEGMAGVGKTALAVHAAHRLRGRFRDVQLSVNLRGYDAQLPPADPAAVLDTFLRRLGCPPERIAGMDLTGRAAEYRRLLAGRRALVLLDNAASEEQVRPLLPDSARCVALVTSRRALVGLAGVRRLSLDVFTASESQAMLRRAAGGSRVGAEPEAAAELADVLGHLPLALGLLASRVQARPEWTLADHLERLVERRANLHLDSEIEVALSLSCQDLPPSLQSALRFLASHPGWDVDRHAAAALADTDPDTAERLLDELRTRNLIQEKTAGRYEFHDLVRTHVTNLARDADPASARHAAVARLLEHYRHAAAVAMDRYAPHERHRRPDVPPARAAPPALADRGAALAWLDAERANLVATARHAADHGQPEHAGQLSAILHTYLDTHAHYRDAETLHTSGVHAPDPAGRAVALTNLGIVRWRLGRHLDALDCHERALAIFRQVGDAAGEARALGNAGNTLWRMGRHMDALAHYERALVAFRRVSDLQGEGVCVGNVGGVHARLGKHDDAADCFRQALVIARKLEDRIGECRALANLGNAYACSGRHQDAFDQLRQALTIARDTADRTSEGRILARIGLVCERSGQHSAAFGRLQQALAVAREAADRQAETETLTGLGATLRSLGTPAQALERAREALTIAQQTGDPYQQALALEEVGHCRSALDDPEAARRHWHSALELHRRLGTPEADAVAGHIRKLDAVQRA